MKPSEMTTVELMQEAAFVLLSAPDRETHAIGDALLERRERLETQMSKWWGDGDSSYYELLETLDEPLSALREGQEGKEPKSDQLASPRSPGTGGGE